MHQTPFQRLLWSIARDAHAAGDRADARILMSMIEAVDLGNYDMLGQLSLAVQTKYRERLGRIPQHRWQDVEAASAQ